MPGIEQRPLASGGVRHVVRVRDPERGKYTSATFATEPEAQRFVRDCADRSVAWALSEYRRSVKSGLPTLNEWSETHFSALTKPVPATINRYRRIYKACWQDELGHLHLDQIGRVEVARALNLVSATRSDKTTLNAWAVLTHMLKMAVVDGLIPRSPTVGVRPSRRTEHEIEEHRYLTQEEFWRVLQFTPERWKPLITTLAGTGMRWGEAAALTVGDIDFVNAQVRITKAQRQDPEVPSGTVVGPVKSRKARRTIALPREVLEALRPLCAGRKASDRLFVPAKGGPLRHYTFYRDVWLKKCVEGAKLPGGRPRLHDLRHSHVAWLIAAGVSLPVIQARLGHEKITTTIDTYGHLLPDVQRAAADAAGMVFQRPRIAAPAPLEIEAP